VILTNQMASDPVLVRQTVFTDKVSCEQSLKEVRELNKPAFSVTGCMRIKSYDGRDSLTEDDQP
jgi:hypothetical protein